jgi:pyrroline-5-carboxylate reductase
VAPHARAIVSVLGGTSVERLRGVYPGVPVFRLMPNTAVEVRRGIVCRTPEGSDGELERQIVELFERVGTVVALSERLMPAALAIVGVGPAYQALLAEAQVDAGIRHGLTAPLASQLVAETMAGAAALLESRGYDTLAVRREVTSPAGSTARGLAALERGGVRTAFQDAIDAVIGWSAE